MTESNLPGRVFGILDLRSATLAELEAWCRMVYHASGGDVSLLVAEDRSHAIAVEPELADRVAGE